MTNGATSETTRRREAVALAGHTGDSATARAHLVDPDPGVRATALGALHRCEAVEEADIRSGLADESAIVRRRSCEIAITWPAIDLVPLLDDETTVAEQAAWALGERGESAGEAAVAALSEMAMNHEDPLCREAAVAALGAIGDADGLPAILHASKDKPPIRRRAVIALAPFDGPEVDEALERAKSDRDWQVRQAAEDLTAPD